MGMMSPYRAFWHPVLTSGELADRPKQARLFGERIVLFRDAEGAPVAFKDICIHRGAALSLGQVVEGTIACPYHGWRYNRAGVCVEIPSLPADATIPAKARATAYHVREQYGLIWVCLEEPRADLAPWPEDAWSNPAFRVFVEGVYEWKTTPARVIENAMDFSHFNFVHKGFTELADGPVIKPHQVVMHEDSFDLAYEDTRFRREYSFVFPFMMHDRKRVVHPEVGGTWSDSPDAQAGDLTIITFVSAPMDESTARIYTILARNHSLNKSDAEFAAGFREVMEQDRLIVESQRPEELPIDLSEELHLRYPDSSGIAYRRLLGQFESSLV